MRRWIIILILGIFALNSISQVPFLSGNKRILQYIDNYDDGGGYLDVLTHYTSLFAARDDLGVSYYERFPYDKGRLEHVERYFESGSEDYLRLHFFLGRRIYVAAGVSGLHIYFDDGDSLIYGGTNTLMNNVQDVWDDALDGVNHRIFCAEWDGGVSSYTEDYDTYECTLVDNQDDGQAYWRIKGDLNYIYTLSMLEGVKIYSHDSGVMTYIDSSDYGYYHYDLAVDSPYIYTVGDYGINIYSFDGSGNLTFERQYASDDHQTTVFINRERWWDDDGGDLLFVGGRDGIKVYSVSDGELTLLDRDQRNNNYEGGAYMDGYIYLACWYSGIMHYRINY